MKEMIRDLTDRIKTNFLKNRISVTAMMLIWVFVVFFTLFSHRDSLGKVSSGNEFFDHAVELSEGLKISETVPVVQDSDVLAIKFATYARRNSGYFDIRVTGADSGLIYAEKRVKVSSLQDNAFTTFRLDQRLDEAVDTKIRIDLTSDCEAKQGAGVYYSDLPAFEGSFFSIDGEAYDGDLSLRFLRESEELNLFYHIVIIWVISSFTLIVLLILLIRPKYETLFTVIAIVFSLTFWLIITPMSAPDETVHYEYSFQMSNYMMGEKDHMVFDEEYQNYGSFAGHLNVSAAYERFIKRINRPLSLKGKMVRMNNDIEETYHICFVPQALGITLARLLKWNMLRTFYLGRLFNLAFYVACVHIAIKKTPVHKLMFGVLATLPVFMQQAASYSYDCYINGLTFVILAFLMKWMHQDELIDNREFIFVLLANLMIAPVKVVYGLFTLLFFFVPEKNYGSRKNKFFRTLILIAPMLYQFIALLFPLLFRILRKIFENLFPASVSAETIDHLTAGNAVAWRTDGEVYTFSYVMNHPLEALDIILRTIRYGIKNWFYGSFGRALSGDSLILPTYLVHSLLAVLVLTMFREEEHTGNLLFRFLIIAFCVFGGLMIVCGMLISWTEINQEIIEDFGGPVIQGVQGRYFSPFLPYLFIIPNNSRVKIPRKFDPYILFAFVVLVFEVVVYVLSYTFMN